MFEAYSTSSTIFTENQPITFSTIRHRDCRINETNGSTFNICTPGRYYVEVNITGLSGTAGTPFSIQLFRNGVAIPAISTETSLATDTTMTMSTIVNVLPSCCAINNNTSLQVVVSSAQSGTVVDRNIIIYRLKQR